MMAQSLIWWIATAGAEAGPSRAAEARAWSLFAVVAILLAIFLIVIGCIATLRAWRRGAEARERRNAESASDVGEDAWSEAGRRYGASHPPKGQNRAE